MNRTSARSTRRLLALSCYFGLVPLLALLRIGREDNFLRHHKAQALATLLWTLPLVVLAFAGLGVLTHLISAQTFLFDLDLAWPVVDGYFVTLWVLGAVWGLLWLAGMGLALAGSVRRLPLIRGDRNRWVQGLAMGWSCLLAVTLMSLGALGWHASRLARSGGGPAQVYLLFDPSGYESLGTWGPKMLFYRVSRAATARWGPGSAVVATMSRESFSQALEHGRMVVLLVHGDKGRIVTRDLVVALPRGLPRTGRYLDLKSRRTGKVEPVKAGDNLQILYNSGCKTGLLGQTWAWQQRLAPTEVIVFDRVSGGLEHLWWTWFDAPKRLQTVQ